jgi:hypothetical protein
VTTAAEASLAMMSDRPAVARAIPYLDMVREQSVWYHGCTQLPCQANRFSQAIEKNGFFQNLSEIFTGAVKIHDTTMRLQHPLPRRRGIMGD